MTKTMKLYSGNWYESITLHNNNFIAETVVLNNAPHNITCQCAVNGVTYEKLALGCGTEVRRLEMFFFGCPRITGLNSFPNLRVLCIVNQRFGQISGLDSCRCLEELWICETQVNVSELPSCCIDLSSQFLPSGLKE